MIKILSERGIEIQEKEYLCLIDYTKVFEKIFYEKLIEMLLPGNALDLHINDIQIIHNLYWEQTFCMRIDKEWNKYTNIERVVC